MTKCPHCFHQVPADKAAFVCVGACAETPDAQYTRFHGHPRDSKPLTIFDRRPDNDKHFVVPASVPCRQCSGKTIECCRTCHHPFPPDWRRGEALCIAFAGPRATGKSNTIATSVHALEGLAKLRNAAFSHATPESHKSYQHSYADPLFERRNLIAPTAAASVADAPQREPLILNFGVSKSGPRFVVLRDTAGEDLQNDTDPDHLKFLGRADLVVYLFDPTWVKEVQDVVRDETTVNTIAAAPLQVLEHVLRLIDDGSPRLAFTLAKVDALWNAGLSHLQGESAADSAAAGVGFAMAMANTGSALRRDIPLTASSREREADLAQVHQEVRSLLLLLHAGSVLNLLENSTVGSRLKKRYFAASALGFPPNSQGLSPHGIAPYRVLDPVLWLMQERRWI